MLGPDYRRPAVTTPDAFRGASAAITPDQQSIAELKWFEVFQDEQLQELIRTALTQNYDLRDAVARVDAARANLGITQADQYPNFGIGADVSSIELSRQGQYTIPSGTSRQRTFGSVFLNLFSFEIDIWGRLRRATEASRAELLAADWNRKAVVTTLISDVATAYFSLLELDMELEIAKNTLATRAESLRLIRLQQQGGVGTLLDVRQGEQLVYGAAEIDTGAERQIEQTENQISFLLGQKSRSISRSHLLTDQQTPPEVPAGLPSTLLERRPDIQAAEQNLVAANAIIGVAKAAYFPQITLTGEFGYQSTALANLFSGSRRIWSFIPQITQPIFAGGRIRSGVELAEAEQRSALAQYERAIQAAFRDVSDALVQYQRVREIRAAAGVAGHRAARSKTAGVSQISRRRRYAAQCPECDRDLFDAELSLAQPGLTSCFPWFSCTELSGADGKMRSPNACEECLVGRARFWVALNIREWPIVRLTLAVLAILRRAKKKSTRANTNP